MQNKAWHKVSSQKCPPPSPSSLLLTLLHGGAQETELGLETRSTGLGFWVLSILTAPSLRSLCTHPDLQESAAGRGPGFLDPLQAPNWEFLSLYHCDHIPGKRIWQACMCPPTPAPRAVCALAGLLPPARWEGAGVSLSVILGLWWGQEGAGSDWWREATARGERETQRPDLPILSSLWGPGQLPGSALPSLQLLGVKADSSIYTRVISKSPYLQNHLEFDHLEHLQPPSLCQMASRLSGARGTGSCSDHSPSSTQLLG